MTHQNTPYVKIYDEKGILTNPITKHKPYFSSPQNRKARREHLKGQTHQNKKGTRLQIFKDLRYVLRTQLIKMGNRIKTITHYDLK
jgi:hypothetical protein